MTNRDGEGWITCATANQGTSATIVGRNAEVGNSILSAQCHSMDFKLGEQVLDLGPLQTTNQVGLWLDRMYDPPATHSLGGWKTEQPDIGAQVDHRVAFLDEGRGNQVDFRVQIPEQKGSPTYVVGTGRGECLSSAEDSVDFFRKPAVDPARYGRPVGYSTIAR